MPTVHCISQQLNLSSVPNCLPPHNAVPKAPGLQGKIFINQINGDIYIYDYANKLLMSTGEIGHDMAEYLQRFLKNQNQKWLKSTAPSWT